MNKKDLGVAVGLTALGKAIGYFILGVRFEYKVVRELNQVVDFSWLKDDLLTTLYYLHIQPPGYNLLLGLMLKTGDLFGPIAEGVYFALGTLLLYCLIRLLREVPVRAGFAWGAAFCFAIHPNFIFYLNWLFYPLLVASMLPLAALLLLTGIRRGSTRRLVAFVLLIFWVVMTRSLYHQLWFISASGVVLFGLWKIAKVPARQLKAVGLTAILCLGVINLWLYKNQRLVGLYQMSSYYGIGLARGWGLWWGAPLEQSELSELKASGVVSEFWTFDPYMIPTEHWKTKIQSVKLFQPNPPADYPYTHPSMTAIVKPSGGGVNMNHFDWPLVSDRVAKDSIAIMKYYPDRYWRRVLKASGNFLEPGPINMDGMVNYELDTIKAYSDFWRKAVYLGAGPIRLVIKYGTFMLIFIVAGLFAFRTRKQDPALSTTLLFSMATVGFVFLLSCLLEISENSRMRWDLETLLILWGTLALTLIPSLKKGISPQ